MLGLSRLPGYENAGNNVAVHNIVGDIFSPEPLSHLYVLIEGPCCYAASRGRDAAGLAVRRRDMVIG